MSVVLAYYMAPTGMGAGITDRENQTSVSSINSRLYTKLDLFDFLPSISLYREMNQDSLDSISIRTLTTPPYSTEVFNAVYHQLCTIV